MTVTTLTAASGVLQRIALCYALGSTLALVDADSGKVLGQQLQRGKADVIDGHGAQVLWTQEAPDLVFEANLSTVAPSDGKAAGLSNVQVIALPGALSNQIVQCRAEAVKIPTFDRDRATGKAAWTFTTRARVESSPLVIGNRIFVGSNDGVLYELDLVSGKKTWEFVAGAPLWYIFTSTPSTSLNAALLMRGTGLMISFLRSCFSSSSSLSRRFDCR